MARSLGWYAYPWNLHQPRADLAQMQGVGMTHLTVASAYHAGKFLQPRDPVSRVYFPEDGTTYFRTHDTGYGRLKPRVSKLTQERDVLRQLTDAGTMPIRAWTVLNHNSRLGFETPEVVARNAWGDPYYYSLCPANGHVRDYAVALCADLGGNYAVETLLLEAPGWLTYGHGYHHEFSQTPLNPWLERLLGLCFCDACVSGASAAGVDMGGIRRAVRKEGDALMAAGEKTAGLEIALAPLDRWREGVVTALCRDVRAAVRREVGVRVISTCQRPHATTYLEGGDLAGMNGVTDGLELPIYQPSTRDAVEDLHYVIRTVGDVDRLSVILRPGLPDMSSEQQVSQTITAMLTAGVRDLSFYNYGLLPAQQIGWLEKTVGAVKDWVARG
ncbi:MAG: hypothetical protein EON87_14215 [Brevundimonas sp.]|nr:MAG: hypothetical protein EON87_14215 [Brevundimonas sp.]